MDRGAWWAAYYGTFILKSIYYGFPGSSAGKESACNSGDPGLIPGLGRSTGERIGYLIASPFQQAETSFSQRSGYIHFSC